MKKKIGLACLLLATASVTYAQVGFNTPNPKSTLDITAKDPTGTARTAEGLLVPRVDRQRAQSMTGVETSTLIYVNNVATGTQTGTAVNIDTPGYYFYNGTTWSKLNMGHKSALYDSDGSLTGNRTVNHNGKTLTFNTAVKNGFGINTPTKGSILSVDGENKRIGIGTTDPQNRLHLGTDAPLSVTDDAGKKLAVYNNIAGTSFYGLGVSANTLQIHAGTARDGAPEMVLTKDGNAGIGTTTPETKLEIKNNGYGVQHTNADGTIKLGSFIGKGSSNGNTDAGWLGTKTNHPLDLMTADAARMRIDANGNVGIGTSAPQNKLDLGATAGTDDSAENGKKLAVYNNATGNQFYGLGVNSEKLQFHAAAVKTAAPGMVLRNNPIDGYNLGIGTTTPKNKLHVVGDIRIDHTSKGAGKVLTSDANGVGTWQTLPITTDTSIYNANGTLSANRTITQTDKTLAFIGTKTNAFSVDGTTFSVDAANDRIGIGTTTPETKLEVKNNGYGVQHTNADGTIKLGSFIGKGSSNGNTDAGWLGTTTNHPLDLMTADAARMRIDANGNVGIGTSAPQNKLDLGTDAATTATDEAGKKLAVYNNASGTSFYGLGVSANTLQLHAASAKTAAPGMVLNRAGNVGIGITDPTSKLHVVGDIRIDHTSKGAGKVLTSDANGIGTWQNLPVTTDTSLYNTNGTLSANRTVTQSDKTLAFTGSKTNAFSVDGTTFSVDAANDRVGIGTSAPQNKLDLGATAGTNDSAENGKKLAVYNNATGSQFYGLGVNSEKLQFHAAAVKTAAPGMVLRNNPIDGYNLGIGTTTPKNKLHIESTTQGAIKIVDGTQANNRVLTSDANGVGTWQNLPVTTDTSLYNTNGTLSANRTVTQSDKTLAFTGSKTNAFSVDGTTFSVDAANDRVGIGTLAPQNNLDLGTSEGTSEGDEKGKKLAVYNNTSGTSFYGLGVNGDILQFHAGSNKTDAPKMVLQNTGNVGIGTTNPQNKLDLGTDAATTATDEAGKKLAVYNNASGTSFYGLGVSANTLQLHAASAKTAAPGMVLNRAGNVGIGITDPTSKLHVVGDIRIDHTSKGAGKVLTSDANGIGTWQNLPVTTDTSLYNTNGTLSANRTVTQSDKTLAFTGSKTNAFSVDGTTFSVDAANDRVGIGTASPQNKLDLGTDAAATATEEAGKKLAVYNNAAGTSFYGLGVSANTLQLHAASAKTAAPAMVLTSTGNVGIGTTNPDNTLHVAGTVKIADGTQGAGKLLVSDASGKATWTSVAGALPPTVFGTTPSGSIPVEANTHIGAAITLKPGKYMVYINQLTSIGTAASSLWADITLSSSTSGEFASGFTFLSNKSIAGGNNTRNSGIYPITGVIPIEVQNNVTLYTRFGNIVQHYTHNTQPGDANYIYAVPIY
jgi:hypothetical protein